jgi:hypothetical protein
LATRARPPGGALGRLRLALDETIPTQHGEGIIR